MNSPTLPQKMEAIRNAISWAGRGLPIFFVRQKEGGRIREPNRNWGEIELFSIRTVERDYVTDIDRDNETGNDPEPRQEVAIGTRQITLQLSVRSRAQEPEKSGWYDAADLSLRLAYNRVDDIWLRPNNITLGQITVINDKPYQYENRIEDLALFELVFFTVIEDNDNAARGTWIESIDATSEIDGLPDAAQMDREIFPEV